MTKQLVLLFDYVIMNLERRNSMQEFEFLCNSKLIKEALKVFGEQFVCKKLDKDTFYGKVKTSEKEFASWYTLHKKDIKMIQACN